MGDDDSESREFRERFIREAQTAGILSHPHIVTIHDIGEEVDTQTSFIAMEYIEGKNLKSLLNERADFSYDQIAEMIAQVAEAIDYAHRKGIVHRDVKPANIIITTDDKVKITDFGIAKIASSNLTTTGQFLGTPNYMSPEQVTGAPVDGRSDIFSLGVVLYELLTHRKPFVGDNLTSISYKIVHEDFTPPQSLRARSDRTSTRSSRARWRRTRGIATSAGKDFALALHQLRAAPRGAARASGSRDDRFAGGVHAHSEDREHGSARARGEARRAADPNAPLRGRPPCSAAGEATQNLRATERSRLGCRGRCKRRPSRPLRAADRLPIASQPESGTPGIPPSRAATPMPEDPGASCRRPKRPPREPPPPRLPSRRRPHLHRPAVRPAQTSSKAAKKAGRTDDRRLTAPSSRESRVTVPLDTSKGKKPPIWSELGPQARELQTRRRPRTGRSSRSPK